MMVNKRTIGDADQFAIIRAFTHAPRDVSANLPDRAVPLPPVVQVCGGSRGGGPLVRAAAV
ncbi:MAG: hypothetical protein LBJ65_31775 [Burkholderia sp.]|jgi:hypothetical protein|uniref:hypothetical protein n=1 Tax=Burkholderia sp. TaxID=36773 RepID=UPI00281B44EC|nr:hypothetical protein [Burkholderia sp.]MDR0246195.1 hypothetical protein [Burkholderia sp.]